MTTEALEPEAAAAPSDPRDRGGPAQPMLIVESLKKYFPIHAGLLNRKVAEVKAVDDVSFFVLKGETLGIVGESGCGKSVSSLAIMRLVQPPGRIVGFTILPGGQIPGLTESDVTFTDDSLSVNFSGIFLSGAGLSTTIELDVEHGIVPEPGSLGLLLLGGLLGLGWARRSAAA